MLRRFTLVPALVGLVITQAFAATNAAIERLEAKVLARHRGVPPASMIRVLGAPNGTAERGGTEFLTWENGKQSGAYVYGVGVMESYSCKATFEFTDGKLSKVSLVGTHGSDRSLCKKLVKPLMKKPPSPLSGVQDPKRSSSASPPLPSPELLTNADVLKLTAAVLPDAVIIAKIKSSACNFDLSTDGLVALKHAAVSDAVIQAMMEAGAK